jgi:hypothetical protein
MRIPVRPVIGLVLLALAGAVTARADDPASSLTITAVRAKPAAKDVEPGVGPGLEKLASKLQRLPFVRFDEDSTKTMEIRRDATESFEMPFSGSGRLVVSAHGGASGAVELVVEEYPPGGDKPCLRSETRVEPGRTHVTFCDGIPAKDGTLVFVSSVR